MKEWSHLLCHNYKSYLFQIVPSFKYYIFTYSANHFLMSNVSLAPHQGLGFLKWKPRSLPARGWRTQEKTGRWRMHVVSIRPGYAEAAAGVRGSVSFSQSTSGLPLTCSHHTSVSPEPLFTGYSFRRFPGLPVKGRIDPLRSRRRLGVPSWRPSPVLAKEVTDFSFSHPMDSSQH